MIAFLASLFTAANAPFTTAMLVVVFSLLFQVVGLLPWASAHHDTDHHAGAHPHDHGHGHPDGHDDGHPGLGAAVLGFLGVGKVPLTVLLQTLFMMFGLAGVSATTLAAWVRGQLDASLLWLSLPTALLLAPPAAAALVRLVARLVPAASGHAATRGELVGASGVVISRQVGGDFGEIRLQDPAGRTLRLICYTADSEPAIPEGTEVVITHWDRERDRLYVASVARLLEGKKP